MTTEQRLERLERENRWMRRTGAVCLAVVAAVLLMGQGEKKLEDLKFDELVKLVANDELPERRRSAALETLGRLDNAPREKVQEIAIGLLRDRTESTLMRGKAAVVLCERRFANETTWSALESRLLDEKDGDEIVQRLCLNKLGATAPLDRIRKLLYDRRVYTHRYFGIRMNVATALAALNVREGVAFDILCQYLVDQDPDDDQFLVRQEAWLSLWTLTGVAYGIPRKELFVRAPKPMPDTERARRYLWSWTYTRPGVSQDQVTALKRVTPDLEQMKAIRDTYRKLKATQLLAWARDRNVIARANCKKHYDAARVWMVITKKTPNSLQDMVAPLKPGEENFMGPIPDDPWGHPYVLKREGPKIRVYSWGEDGQEGTDDDIVYPEAK
jgi:hypothetical protein